MKNQIVSVKLLKLKFFIYVFYSNIEIPKIRKQISRGIQF